MAQRKQRTSGVKWEGQQSLWGDLASKCGVLETAKAGTLYWVYATARHSVMTTAQIVILTLDVTVIPCALC